MNQLIYALIIVGVIAIVASVITAIVKEPPIVRTIVWAAVAIVALVVLGRALMGII